MNGLNKILDAVNKYENADAVLKTKHKLELIRLCTRLFVFIDRLEGEKQSLSDKVGLLQHELDHIQNINSSFRHQNVKMFKLVEELANQMSKVHGVDLKKYSERAEKLLSEENPANQLTSYSEVHVDKEATMDQIEEQANAQFNDVVDDAIEGTKSDDCEGTCCGGGCSHK